MKITSDEQRRGFTHRVGGFTLVELLLYMSITATIILSIAGFFPLLMQSRVKNQTIAEVEQQGMQVMQFVTRTIRNAEGITTPIIGNSGSGATIDVVTASLDPAVFDLTGGVIRVTEGSGSAIQLTNTRVTASGLTFHNVSRTDTPGILKIQFTLSHINPEGRQEYNYIKTFYGTASRRYQ